MKQEYNLSTGAACRSLNLSCSVCAYQTDPDKELPVIEVLLALAEDKPAHGFGLMYDTFRGEGKPWNHNRVYRLYKALKSNLRCNREEKPPVSISFSPYSVPESINQCWSVDFMSDSLMTLSYLQVVDECNREALAIAVDINLPSRRVIRALD